MEENQPKVWSYLPKDRELTITLNGEPSYKIHEKAKKLVTYYAAECAIKELLCPNGKPRGIKIKAGMNLCYNLSKHWENIMPWPIHDNYRKYRKHIHSILIHFYPDKEDKEDKDNNGLFRAWIIDTIMYGENGEVYDKEFAGKPYHDIYKAVLTLLSSGSLDGIYDEQMILINTGLPNIIQT